MRTAFSPAPRLFERGDAVDVRLRELDAGQLARLHLPLQLRDGDPLRIDRLGGDGGGEGAREDEREHEHAAGKGCELHVRRIIWRRDTNAPALRRGMDSTAMPDRVRDQLSGEQSQYWEA